MNTTTRLVPPLALLALAGGAHAQEDVSMQELRELVERQQERISVLEQRLDATGDAVESMRETAGAQRDRTSIGGYGELHYNNVDASESANDADEIDFHRFVLFFGHEFNDRVSFNSELEIEHALSGDGEPGEVELEQAFVRFAVNDNLAAKTGLFLVPVGILNETHEPPTFYGVERNAVESVILPSTWWEAGGGVTGTSASGLSWDLAVHSGLAMPTAGDSAFRIRSGRQKVAEALASDFAVTGRVRYTGVPGLQLAASVQYQSDPSQIAGDGLDSGRLVTTHAIYESGPFSLRALYARWDFEGAAIEASGDDTQTGAFIEPGYRFGGEMNRWGIYARYEDVEGARAADEFTQHELGFNYWPIDDVTLKFSYREREHDLAALAGADFDALQLGVGYQF